MMMQMLGAGGMPLLTDNIRGADIDNPDGYFEFEAVKQLERDASWLDSASGKAVKMVYRLLYKLPRNHAYKVILMNRQIEEVIASQDAMLRRQGGTKGALNERDLARVFRHQLSELHAWLQKQPNFDVLTVDYNSAVADPVRAAQEIGRFLGNGLDTGGMARVCKSSLYRQRHLAEKDPPN